MDERKLYRPPSWRDWSPATDSPGRYYRLTPTVGAVEYVDADTLAAEFYRERLANLIRSAGRLDLAFWRLRISPVAEYWLMLARPMNASWNAGPRGIQGRQVIFGLEYTLAHTDAKGDPYPVDRIEIYAVSNQPREDPSNG